MTGLILAYLYTGEPTREVIEGMLERQAWNAFPDAAFIERFGLQTPGVQCLLVFDGDREHLVAFADSSRFAQELITYQQNGMSKTVETALNKNPQVDALMKLFPSLSDNVLSGSATRALVEEMIRNQIAEAVALDGRAPYLLELQNIISLAAKPD